MTVLDRATSPGQAPAAAEPGSPPSRSRLVAPLFLGVLLLALALRLNGLDWDQSHLFHPDERAILMKVWDLHLPWPPDLPLLVDSARSPLNPRWFAYGSFPLYLLKGTGFALSFINPAFLGPDLRLVGRVLSALFDTGTVALLFFLGRRLYGAFAGLLAASLAALAVLHIQLSHFYAVDVQLTFFIVLTLYVALRWADGGRLGDGLLTGVALGMALATKVSALPLLIPVGVAAWLAARPTAGHPDASSSPTVVRASPSLGVVGASPSPAAVGAYCNTPLPVRWATAALGLGLALVAAAGVFVLLQPYAVLDWNRFLADTVEQSEMVRRVRDYPYTRQYVDTPPFLYQFQQLGQWGLGWPLALLGWAGLAWAGWRAARGSRPELLLLAFALPYGLLTGAFAVKFLRYLLPLVPLLCLFGAGLAAAMLSRGWGSAGRRPVKDAGEPPALPRAGRRPALPGSLASLARVAVLAILAAMAAATLLYALAFESIYAAPHPAVAMATWIREHVPKGSLILREHWEEGLPGLGDYPQRQLPLYEPDSPPKLKLLASELAQAEAVLFYSNRLYGTIPRLPHRYPLTARYYQLLFAGELGFELAHATQSFPRLGPIALRDDTLSRPGLPKPPPLAGPVAPLTIDGGYADESFTVYDHPQSLLFRKTRPLSAAELETLLGSGQPADGEISRPSPGLLLSPEEAATQRAGGTWSERFAADTPAWGGWPLAAWLLLVEAAALAAFPLAFLALRGLPDGGYLLAKPLGLLLLAYLTWLAASLHWAPFARGSVGASLALLAAAGGVAAWVSRRALASLVRRRWRLLLAGELLFLAAFLLFYALRLMNPDLWHPWRGGEKPMDFAYLNAVAKSTFFPPYDPWFAGGHLNYYYFGQVIIAVLLVGTTVPPAIGFNLAIPLLFALTAASAFAVGVALASHAGGAASGRRAGLAGGLAALLVAVAGNLNGAAQLLEGLARLGAPSGAATASLGAGLLRLARGEGSLPLFDFWRSSRMMPPTPNITEFPYFSFLFADLHAHVLALPFTVLAIGLATALLLEPRPSPRSLAFPLIGLALTVGALRVTNSWDFPTYLLLGAGALLLVAARSRKARALALAGGAALALPILATLLYAPFHSRYQLFYQGVVPSAERTPLHQYLAVHGLFLFLVASYVIGRLVPLASRSTGKPVWMALPLGALAAALAAGLLVSPLVGFLLGMGLAIGVTLAAELAQQSRPGILFALLLALVATLLSLGVEFVAVEGDIGRMNTVFKFYLQAWVLWAVAAAVLAAVTLGALAGRRRRRAPLGGPLQAVWSGAALSLLAGSLVYPLLATPARLADRFAPLPPTQDGMAFMGTARYRDDRGEMDLSLEYTALRWIQANVSGSPVILEGLTPLYRWGSRVSVYTGLPAVVGWDWHQKQQRWIDRDLVERRVREVNEAYASPDPEPLRRLLRRYDVAWLVVGQVERAYYPPSGLAKIDQMVGRELDVAYQNPGFTLYRVLGA